MKTNFFKYLMFIPLVCFVAACSDDDPAPEPLKPAFIELETATDAKFILNGNAHDTIVVLKINREIEVSKEAAWVTTEATLNEEKTAVSLKISVGQSDAAKRRTATLTLTTKLADESDKAAAPVTIDIEQGVYGLVEADLVNLVFDVTGGPNSARDISPLANTVLDVLPFSGQDPDCPKVYPAISMNNDYGRYTAYFAGSNECGKNNARGSCAYRLDIVDYSQYQGHYDPANISGNTPIPFNALGDAMRTGSFSMEVLFKPAPRVNNGASVIGFTQGWGGSIGCSKNGEEDLFSSSFYMDTNANGGEVSQETVNHSVNFVKNGENVMLNTNTYYHAVGVYDKTAGRLDYYIDGVRSDTYETLRPGYGMKLADIASGNRDGLAQWICIGGDTRRSDPVIGGNAVHINSDYENWAESIFKGEVVLFRMYSKALTAEDVKILYDYEKPE
jgi:hypothetical protein